MTSTFGFVADLDTGPAECVLSRLRASIPLESPDVHVKYLEFAEEYKFKAQEFASLLVEYQNLHLSIRQQLVTQTVSRWIFSTNKIESTGLATEGETLNFLLSRVLPDTTAEREVAYTYELLQETYDVNRDLSRGVLDPEKTKKWHKTLAIGVHNTTPVLPNPGNFRKVGVRALAIPELNEPEHIYPHHRSVPFLLDTLGATLYRLGLLVTQDAHTGYRRILYIFALAAFAQFHFVDIHPFQDGNGRLCRFVSKFILDSICPVPFPMFPPSTRLDYFKSLIYGRHANPTTAPSQLLALLLDTAIKEYSEIIKRHSIQPYHLFLCGTEVAHITKQLDETHFTTDDQEKSTILSVFTDLTPNAYKDVVVKQLKVRVKKMVQEEEYITLDSL